MTMTTNQTDLARANAYAAAFARVMPRRDNKPYTPVEMYEHSSRIRAIKSRSYNAAAQDIERSGIRLTSDEVADLGADAIEWVRKRLRCTISTDDTGVTATSEHPIVTWDGQPYGATATILNREGYGGCKWESDPDTDDGAVLCVTGEDSADVAACVTRLRAAGLQASESHDDTGRWIRAVRQ
jgi:hypothetical protein